MAESRQGPSGGVQYLQVDVDDSGQRLDNYLMRKLRGVPKTRLYRALRRGEVRVNKGRVKADYRLVAGDRVRIPPLRLPAAQEPAALPRYWAQLLQQRIVYEDGDLLVINKPSGLAVHGGSGLSFGLIEGLRRLRPEDRYLELVHRLDRDTSGLILIARRPAILRELHRQLREDRVDKRYRALVCGRWPRRLGRVDAPLEKNVLKSGERMVRVSQEGKRAVTEFSVLERFGDATLLEAKPVTGRTHQIRVHAQHAGCPLMGDEKYASDRALALGREMGLKRLFLHASQLRFSLPNTGPLELSADLDPDLEIILEKLRN
jgi:23S rRNA pseudouridine955/2504/2580 synthase